MSKPTDIRPISATLYFLPIQTRMPLKFGPEVTTQVTCARVALTVADRAGRTTTGWGETPLSVQWVWPSTLPYATRHDLLIQLTQKLTTAWADFATYGHPLEIGHDFTHSVLPAVLTVANQNQADNPIPHLAALVCSSPFDIALHDAFGRLHDVPTYDTYSRDWMNTDLSHYFDNDPAFANLYPSDFLIHPRPDTLPAWHLVGGKDPLDPSDLTGDEPINDGHPVLLRDWIKTDGLDCLKIKLTGTDPAWDRERLLRVGHIAAETNVTWLTADFNCTVHNPEYVNTILDTLMRNHPRTFQQLLYVEQPFPYDLEAHPLDVHSVSARKPLFLDESAHDWTLVRLGRSLGWTGVALKTCKTQTGAILSLCWAKSKGMTLMVQDLTNPMLAQIPHVLLAAHAGTIMGVETNGMQFYPDASKPEAAIHPGLYQRRQGRINLSTIQGPGFGYRLEEIERTLPPPAESP